MIALLDVHYFEDAARAACVVADPGAAVAASEHTRLVSPVAPYEPGAFYRRELPCLLAVLEEVDWRSLDALVVDGYVWLDRDGRPGLGAHLWEALGEEIPVLGVAKNAYGAADFAAEVLRGESERPLYVTAAGWPQATAAEMIAAMHGPYRIPTLLRRVDTLCRAGAG